MNETDIFRRIQGLIAKAEGTDNEHEAEAFYAKAQELMVKYAVDEAVLRAAAGNGQRKPGDGVVVAPFQYSSTHFHSGPKASILNAVAVANRCRIVLHSWNGTFRRDAEAAGEKVNRTSQWATIVGFPADTEYVKLLYTSLLLQELRLAEEAAQARGLLPETGIFAFKSGHMYGFASTIARRFREQNEKLATATTSALVVINEDVDAKMAQLYPDLKAGRSHKTDHAGWMQGSRDGHRADIGNPALTGSRRGIAAGR